MFQCSAVLLPLIGLAATCLYTQPPLTEHEYQRGNHNQNERIWKLNGFWKSSTRSLLLNMYIRYVTSTFQNYYTQCARYFYLFCLQEISLGYTFVFGATAHKWAWVSSFTRLLDHTQRRNIVGKTPLDELSARRRDLYLSTHNTHNRQRSMPPLGFEPTISAGERPQTYALDRAATGTGIVASSWLFILLILLSLEYTPSFFSSLTAKIRLGFWFVFH